MCVEYFIDQKDVLLVNEIAPRVHNSGHLTINAFNISQFENHVRAVCGLGKDKVIKIANAEMINILGKEIEEYRKKSLSDDEFFSIMGKKIKDKRKMGHLTTLKNNYFIVIRCITLVQFLISLALCITLRLSHKTKSPFDHS